MARPLSVVIAGEAQTLGLPPAIIEMIRWPQFATALAGGILVFDASALARRGGATTALAMDHLGSLVHDIRCQPPVLDHRE